MIGCFVSKGIEERFILPPTRIIPSPSINGVIFSIDDSHLMLPGTFPFSLACQFTPFFNHNTLIAIQPNEAFFISAPNSTNSYEKCNDSDYTLRTIRGRGIIQLDSFCSIKTNNYIIHSHVTSKINATQTILPALNPNFNFTQLSTDILQTIQNYSTSSNEPIIIHNTAELQNIISSQQKLVEKASHEFKIKQLHYDSESTSCLSSSQS